MILAENKSSESLLGVSNTGPVLLEFKPLRRMMYTKLANTFNRLGIQNKNMTRHLIDHNNPEVSI
jgi:hypothetical protein